ncbi:MAG: L7Ae/L30e/S12e/Gadd45 family ribosomal protein [Lachnospiraceae bacterium]
MKQNKLYSLLGLAQRSGNLASGEFMTEKCVKERKCFQVIVAEDASDNTKKNFRDMCVFYHVPLAFVGTKEGLGHAIGKEIRASIAVKDSGFAESIRKQFVESGVKQEVDE